MALQQQMVAKQEIRKQEDEKKMKVQGAENKIKGDAFLAENKKKPGVITLPDGLQYKVIKEGTGKKPSDTSQVKVHYTGKFIDGKTFDSSVDRGQPATFGCNQVIKGWTEALMLMKEGSKMELVIPPDLAYGEAGRPGIPPNSVLVFDVELLEIVAGK
jgi:FKBP-type peptidyl-prolyl cis-trans isomerase FklB